MYKGFSVRLRADFSSETQCDDIFKVLGKTDHQPRVLCLAKLFLRNEEVRSLPNKQQKKRKRVISRLLYRK